MTSKRIASKIQTSGDTYKLPKWFLIPRTFRLLVLGFMCFLLSWECSATNNTEVAITFLRDSGAVWDRPIIGEELHHPELPKWKVDANTTIRFKFTSSSRNGSLVLLIKNKQAAEIIPGQPNPDPEQTLAGYVEYKRITIPLSQAGISQVITLGNLAQTPGWSEEVYLGFFAISGDTSSVEAFANGQQIGSSHVSASETSPAFNLRVLYDPGTPHPSLPEAYLIEGNNSHGFTDMETQVNSQTLHGAISNFSYQVKDTSTLPVGTPSFALDGRIWELYKIESNGTLTLQYTFAGEGDLGKACPFQVPENTTAAGVRYLLLCRTYDALGYPQMAQPTSLSDPNLTNNCFIFEVGRDVTKNPENCLVVSTSTENQPPFSNPICGLDLGVKVYFRFMTLGGSDIDNSIGTTHRYNMQIILNDTQAPITTGAPLPLSGIGDWPWVNAFSDDDFPIHIKWGYTNEYGTTSLKEVASIEYDYIGGNDFDPEIHHFGWDSLPTAALSEFPLDLSYQINTHHALPHMFGSFWILNADNPGQHARLEETDGLWQQILHGGTQQLDTLILPEQINNWGLSPGSRLRIRMKAVWAPSNQNISEDEFLTGFNSPGSNPHRKYKTEETFDWVITDAGAGHFQNLEKLGTGRVNAITGNMDLTLEETHSGTPDPVLAWRWETTVGNQRYLWLGHGWQPTGQNDETWIEIGSGLYGSGLTDPFSSRWEWESATGNIQPKWLNNNPNAIPPLAPDEQTALLESFFTPSGQGSALENLDVRIRVRMSFQGRPEFQETVASLTKFHPPTGHFNSLMSDGDYLVNSQTGDMAFHFIEVHSGEPDPQLFWRWETADGAYLWIAGAWQPTGDFEDTWVTLGTGAFPGGMDTFSSRWVWDRQGGQIRPLATNQSTATPPLVDDQGNSLVNAFFTLPGNQAPLSSVDVQVRVRMGFDGAFEEQSISLFNIAVLEPEPGIEAFSFSLAKEGTLPACGESTDWLEASNFHGRLGNLPRMQFSLTTTGSQVTPITLRIEKKDDSGEFVQLNCLTMGTPLFESTCHNSPSLGENLQRWWVADDDQNPNQDNLFDVLATHGAGIYRLRLTTQDCNSDAEGNAEVFFTLNPDESFAIRFHYRDHIGSSTISRAYTPTLTNAVTGHAFILGTDETSQDRVVLYPQAEQSTFFSPFGEPLGDVSSEPDPRFTDHEYDPESGFNYMKARYQIATHAKFNRPDPMRDWDWENPSSINLYQYVSNDPINKFDPTGMYQTDGHYWTIRYLALKAGYSLDQAKQIAKGAAFPDKWYSGLHPVLSLVYDWSWIAGKPTYAQRNYHALTGGNGLLATMNAFANIKNYEGSLFGLGKLFHTFGDSFAHRKDNDFDTYYWGASSTLFVGPFGHLIIGRDRLGKEIDEPPGRKELYRHYVNLAFTLLKERRGSEGDFDPSVIEGVLNTDNANKAGRIAIFSAAIAVEEARIEGTLNEPITVEVDEEGLQAAIDWAISQGYTVLVNGIPYDDKPK